MRANLSILFCSVGVAMAITPDAKCSAAYKIHVDSSCPDLSAYDVIAVNSSEACCSACKESKKCTVWTFDNDGKNAACRLKAGVCESFRKQGRRITGVASNPPAPTPPEPPSPSPPRPDPAKGAPNIIFVLTDDQDLRLGSMSAMPYTARHVLSEGANMTNFFVNTPICCPSRTVLLSGRMNHNNKANHYIPGGGVVQDGCCMYMNTSQTMNPGFWANSFISELYHSYGYATGAFGKVLNTMRDYGCNNKTKTDALDRMFVMCKHVFYNEQWIDQGAPDSPKGLLTNNTGSSPSEYTTSLIGNATLRWIKSIVDEGPNHRPFFAWVGPHAPHLPSTPAEWYLNHPVGNESFPKEDYWGYLGSDKHAFFPEESEITSRNEAGIQDEYSRRQRSLLSVDDLIQDIREYLIGVGEWDNTYFIFSSDHGYSLGQFRVLSHKMQVYDHNTRVPFIVKGPGIKQGSQLSIPTSMVDVAPTILELVGAGGSPARMDGQSFAQQLMGKSIGFPRDAVLIEYQSIHDKSSGFFSCADETDDESRSECISAHGYHEGPFASLASKHPSDGPNNTFSAIRIIGDEGDFLYAEFVDVTDPDAWFFAPDKINFYELYDLSSDPYMLKNTYAKASTSMKKALHQRLQQAIWCNGRESCTQSLGGATSLVV